MSDRKVSLLGGFEVAGSAPGQPALTRKGRAMLAYLALNSGRAQSRDKLAALLWGGNGNSQARTNLRQTLSTLRKAMSFKDGELLTTAGDDIILNPDDLTLDVARFEELAASTAPEELEQAVTLYKGDLLDGFSLREQAFEEWLRAERERLRTLAIGALEKLTAHYREVGEVARCAQAAARLLCLDPLREDVHRTLMRAYAAQDRLSLALKQYEVCREALQRELGVRPEPETQLLFDEIRARRMRFADMPSDSRQLPELQTAMQRQLELAPPLDSDPPLPAKPSVAVLAFENNSGDADQAYFANGITENIIIGLTRFHELFVIGLKSALGAHAVSTDVREIGRRLGVAHVVQGSVRKAGDRVRVTVQLIEAATARRLWAEQYDRSLDDMLAVEDEITDLIVTTLAGRIEQASSRRAAKKPPRDMAAYDYLLRAREESRHRTREGELAARVHLDRALELDPELAAAYACYAISYIHEYESAWCPDRRGALDRALRFGRKAVSLDETDAYTHQALAYAAHYSGESELARKEIDRAILLNPHDYPNLCIRAWIVMFLGRPDVALSDLNEALRLNPIATEMCLITIGIAEYMAALYRESTETFARMSTWDSLRYACLAACHAQLGQPEQARANAEKLITAAKAEFGGEAADSLQRWRAYAESMLRFQQPGDLARFAEGLRKAGLPFMTQSAA